MDFTKNITDIDFIYNPDPVPYSYRISYKVAQICILLMILARTRGCSLLKIQIVSCALSNEYDMHEVTEFIEGRLPDYSMLRFDPAVNRALRYTLVEELVKRQKNGTYKLTEKGSMFAQSIYEDSTLMIVEKGRLAKIVGHLDEDEIFNLAQQWRYDYVKD